MQAALSIHASFSEETAHPNAYHHLSQLSVDIQLSVLTIKLRESLGENAADTCSFIQLAKTKTLFIR